ncbi:Lem3/Cdc50 [Hyphopichia burtonii NRRL Y-1933]|uniref:Lem3/Cdc50 n=1 Tax=Hyphopichia burtonii NRRL Y-1933 TaxID=984485 RepID=A0A1E4RBW8_9ASCO|nr:Lem3/Cdc50 [Hyphopichia burtonii NRRL Y-1933]ODV64752.1 Lem3/Cdc50 [Hyphopichia burtonii NRRL Y-1933]
MSFLRKRKNHDLDDDESDDMISGNGNAASNRTKSRKPPNTAFRQQRLKAWQPILTPKTVIPLFFILACIFAPLGIAIIHSTYNVQTLQVDYSKCGSLKSKNYESIPSKYTSFHFKNKNTNPDYKWRVVNGTDDFDDLKQTCQIQFTLPVDLKPPIYLYYKLNNFFQNHRKYVSSYDLEQLKGIAVTKADLENDCSPVKERDDKIIYPCGLIANSFFNDTFESPVLLNAKSGSNNETYELSEKGISWGSDLKHKYKKTNYKASDIVPPPNWYKMFPDGYNDSNLPDLHKWEHLQNWMRTAGLPTFYKLYGKNTTSTMSSGTYEISIGMNYPVSIFGGTKTLVITTNSVFGGRNLSLGVIYIIVAIVSLVLGVAFLLQHLIKPRRIGDHNYLQGSAVDSGFRDGPRQANDPISTFRDQL